ncbi:hypothetical protein AB0M36_16845 [Actinoplanes sp. NPDC051346]|uniref:hypothetical protein n=1 Tax=Actinoplanes sp. NPDC051346 TaxID=3155048 RepID=UPI0034188E5B
MAATPSRWKNRLTAGAGRRARQALLDGLLGGRHRWTALGAVLLLVAAVGGTSSDGRFGLAAADGTTPVPVPADQVETVVTAALSCPVLTGPRLAAQIMATTGFQASAASANGGQGLAGMDDAAWKKWIPWQGAKRTDDRANILALAHQTCELAGQVRAANIGGDQWLAAVAATRVGLPAIVAAKGIPASARNFVDLNSSYANWYASRPEFRGPNVGPSASAAPSGSTTVDARRVPDAYVADIVRAGHICPTVTPARIAAQLMAASKFDPNLRSATGGQGIAQFTPQTWQQHAGPKAPANVSPWNPSSAITTLGQALCDLSTQLAPLTSSDAYVLALAAHRWGVTAVRQAGGLPPSPVLLSQIQQTMGYVDYYSGDTRLDPAASTPTSPPPSPSASASPSASPSPSPPASPSTSPAESPSPPSRPTSSPRRVPTLTTSTPTVEDGESITFSYSTPPAMNSSTNWIGVYRPGDTPGDEHSTAWQYTPGTNNIVTFTADFGRGDYDVYYFSNDGYTILAGPVTICVW